MDDDTTGAQLSSLSWRKSRYSGALGNCVELAPLADRAVAVRNSRQPDGPVLVYSHARLATFLAGAKNGEFGGGCS
jgi:hypothetical protein